MQIDAKQLKSRPKKIGRLHDRDVFQVVTKGGWNMIVAPKGNDYETLGTGSHQRVAFQVSQKLHPDIKWTGLAKGSWEDEAAVAHLVPKYVEVTLRIRALRGE